MRRFYVYDPAPTLRNMKAPLLAIFGELDTPEAVKANVTAIRRVRTTRAAAITPSKSTPTARTT